MIKLTFANKNIIVVEGYKVDNAVPAKAPSLKAAAQIAVDEINKGITPDCAVTTITEKGDLKDIIFENSALLTVPAEYEVAGYKHALEIVVSEIQD